MPPRKEKSRMRKFLRLALMAGADCRARGARSRVWHRKKSSSGTTTTIVGSSRLGVSRRRLRGTFSSGTPAKGGTYTVGWEAVVRLHRQLRPDRRVPRQRLGHLLEPDGPHARRLQAPARRGRERSSSATSRRRVAEADRTAARPTRSTSSRASSSARRSTARSPRRTSSTRWTGSPTRRTAASTRSTTR